eukprot:gene14454-20466_t
MEQIKTVHYVTKDPIQNLKVKVTLTRISVHRSKTRLPTPGQALEPPPPSSGGAPPQPQKPFSPQQLPAITEQPGQQQQQQQQAQPQSTAPYPIPANAPSSTPPGVDTSISGFDAVQGGGLLQAGQQGPLQQGQPQLAPTQQDPPLQQRPSQRSQQQAAPVQQAGPLQQGQIQRQQALGESALRLKNLAPSRTSASGGAPPADTPALKPTNSVGLPMPPPGSKKFFSPLSSSLNDTTGIADQPKKGQPIGEADKGRYGAAGVYPLQGTSHPQLPVHCPKQLCCCFILTKGDTVLLVSTPSKGTLPTNSSHTAPSKQAVLLLLTNGPAGSTPQDTLPTTALSNSSPQAGQQGGRQEIQAQGGQYAQQYNNQGGYSQQGAPLQGLQGGLVQQGGQGYEQQGGHNPQGSGTQNFNPQLLQSPPQQAPGQGYSQQYDLSPPDVGQTYGQQQLLQSPPQQPPGQGYNPQLDLSPPDVGQIYGQQQQQQQQYTDPDYQSSYTNPMNGGGSPPQPGLLGQGGFGASGMASQYTQGQQQQQQYGQGELQYGQGELGYGQQQQFGPGQPGFSGQYPQQYTTQSMGWDDPNAVAQWQAQAPQFDPATGQFTTGGALQFGGLANQGGATPMGMYQTQPHPTDQFSFPSLPNPTNTNPSQPALSFGVGPDGTPLLYPGSEGGAYQFGQLTNFPDYLSSSAAAQYTGWPMTTAPDGSSMPAPMGPDGLPLPMHAYPIIGPNGQPVIGPDGQPMM